MIKYATEIAADEAIDRAVDKAYVLFRTFGWEYYDGPPDRKRLKEALREQVDSVLEGEADCAVSGRFCVRKHNDGEVVLRLNLSSFWIEGDAQNA